MVTVRATTLLPSERVGGLVSAASPLAGGWEGGLDIGSNQCLSPTRIGKCEAIDPPVWQRPHLAGRYDSVIIRQPVKCSTLDRQTDVPNFAAATLSVTSEYALARELQDGQVTGNPALEDLPSLGTATDLTQAIAWAEWAAGSLSGRVAFIHVPAALAVYLPSLDNGRTAAGNVVVVSPGYLGTSIYVTGEVWVGLGSESLVSDVVRTLNDFEAIAETYGIAVFDPCFGAQIGTSYTFPEESPVSPASPASPTSPGGD